VLLVIDYPRLSMGSGGPAATGAPARRCAPRTIATSCTPPIVVQRDLGAVNAPTLVLQCSDDVIAPRAVGEYVHRHVPDSQLVMMNATGHCPNLSAPDETVREIRTLLQSLQ